MPSWACFRSARSRRNSWGRGLPRSSDIKGYLSIRTRSSRAPGWAGSLLGLRLRLRDRLRPEPERVEQNRRVDLAVPAVPDREEEGQRASGLDGRGRAEPPGRALALETRTGEHSRSEAARVRDAAVGARGARLQERAVRVDRAARRVEDDVPGD